MALNDPVRLLIADLGKVPPELRRQTTRALGKAVGPMVADAQRRASWSKRIPAAMTVRTRYSGPRPGVVIRVRAGLAPHARPYEGLPGYRTFRHQVHGHDDRWVQQATRPYLAPSVEAKAGAAVQAVAGAVEDSARRHGWR